MIDIPAPSRGHELTTRGRSFASGGEAVKNVDASRNWRRKGGQGLVQSSNSRKCRLISVYCVNGHGHVRHRVSRIFHRTGRAMNGDRVVGKVVVCSLYYLGELQAIFGNIECISCEFYVFSSILLFFIFLFLLRIIYSKVSIEGILYFT